MAGVAVPNRTPPHPSGSRTYSHSFKNIPTMDRRQYAPNHRSNNSGAEIIQSEPMS